MGYDIEMALYQIKRLFDVADITIEQLNELEKASSTCASPTLL